MVARGASGAPGFVESSLRANPEVATDAFLRNAPLMHRYELSDGAQCELHEQWLAPDAATDMFHALHGEIPWEARRIQVFGRQVMQPRLVAWVGDPDAVYTYSRTRHAPLPWTRTLSLLRARVVEVTGHQFNSVLCNLYRDGRDSMGMHSDDEPELGADPVIVSLSLGAPRRFLLRHRLNPQRSKLDLVLTSGSLLIMRGATQRAYRHRVPKEPRVTLPRINLTFRHVLLASP